MHRHTLERKEWLDHYRWRRCVTCKHFKDSAPSMHLNPTDKCEIWVVMPGELWNGGLFDRQFKILATECDDYLCG
jgi:hypothetical protein